MPPFLRPHWRAFPFTPPPPSSLRLSAPRWEDRTNYGAEDYGGASTEDRAAPFAQRVFRRAARQQEPEVEQRREATLGGASPGSAVGGAPLATRERMYWALVSLWEEGIGLELAARFAATARRRR